MKLKSIIESERKSMEKINKIQLSSKFKFIGSTVFSISLVSTIILSFLLEKSENKDFYIITAKFLMLLGMLMVSLSKEEIEDELVVRMRMQSYSFAFICAIMYVLVLPFVGYFFGFIRSNSEGFENMGDFTILGLLLTVQLAMFNVLKYSYNEK